MKIRTAFIPITLSVVAPRNPFAIAARQRRAGAHRDRRQDHRRQDARALQREIDDLHPPHR